MPAVDLGVGRQELQRAVEVAALLQPVDQPLVHREHRVLLRAGVAEQDVLLVVVAQHLVRRRRRSSTASSALRCLSVRSPARDHAGRAGS